MEREQAELKEWMRYARASLAMGKGDHAADVPLEMLCFEAQQSAQKGIKAVLVFWDIEPPETGDIRELFSLLPADVPRPAEAETLSPFAEIEWEPWRGEPVSEQQYQEALHLAEAVVSWARDLVA